MAGTWTSERFPRFKDAVSKLTEQHLELKDEPLYLALSYQPVERNQQHIYLFEVIGAFDESINPEGDLFEVTFTPTAGFPMDDDQELHLILTNPRELDIALKQGWSLADEVVGAIREGDYQVLYENPIGKKALASLLAEASRQGVDRG